MWLGHLNELKNYQALLKNIKTLLFQFLSHPAVKGPLDYCIVNGICRKAARTNMKLNNRNIVLLLKKKEKCSLW